MICMCAPPPCSPWRHIQLNCIPPPPPPPPPDIFLRSNHVRPIDWSDVWCSSPWLLFLLPFHPPPSTLPVRVLTSFSAILGNSGAPFLLSAHPVSSLLKPHHTTPSCAAADAAAISWSNCTLLTTVKIKRKQQKKREIRHHISEHEKSVPESNL